MQVMLEATVVAQTLHLAQVTNNSFGTILVPFLAKKDYQTTTASLLVIILSILIKIKNIYYEFGSSRLRPCNPFSRWT